MSSGRRNHKTLEEEDRIITNEQVEEHAQKFPTQRT
jgi:hypothetical protein